ncbi:MAG TPA: hypothetical protein VFV25_07365 [Methylibium sp.]
MKSTTTTQRSVPDALPLRDALERSAPLERLRQRIADSNARLAALLPCLPQALLPHVSAGPVDEAAWTLLARNAAVAAKLRQLQPRLEAALRQQGWEVSLIRIRVQPGEATKM